MTSELQTLWTVSRIAQYVRVARHRVEYVVDSRRIAPVGRAGIARVFDRRDVDLIAEELRRIDADQEGRAYGD